jgi:hypothetical protein
MVAQPLCELPTRAILFLRKLTQVCDPFFAALEVRSSTLPFTVCHSQGRRSKVLAKSAGSENPDFTVHLWSYGYATLWTVALKAAAFQMKKWFTTNCLGQF